MNINNFYKQPFLVVSVLLILAIMLLLIINAPKHENEIVVDNVDVKVGKGNKDILVVLLHAYTLNNHSLDTVKETLNKIDTFKGADFLTPNMPFDTFSMVGSSKITSELLMAIDKAWDNRVKIGKPYKRIVIIGHSIGALYGRKLYVIASGENNDTKFEQSLKNLIPKNSYGIGEPRPWAKVVDRIILLAGMNRGWSISHHMSIPRAISMQIGVIVGHVLEWFYERPPIIFTVRRGSPFITQLRLQWLSMKRHAETKGVGNAITVQLLGSIDDLVSPDDNIDLVSGSDFVYIDVPKSGHKDVILMDCSTSGKKRQQALIKSLNIESRSDVSQVLPEEVTDVVFVIHGIRDEGYWTRKIARRVQQTKSKNKHVIATETSSYGYFPMLSFLLPGARQEKVEWFMDKYTEAKATYPPNARYHFIGHSHGTYLLAKALENYDSVHFDQVLFAGSVVHQDYQWERYIPDRIKYVYNFEATADWVVAFFPKALQSIGIQDLGSAGHDGFKSSKALPKNIKNHTYIIGGHSAAIQEDMWDPIAEFVLTGKFSPPPDSLHDNDQTKLVSWPAKIAPLLWLAILVLLGWLLYLLFNLKMREWKKTLVITTYITFIWIVLTEV